MNLETPSLNCEHMKKVLADIEMAIKLLLSDDVLCLIGYLVKNLRKKYFKPPPVMD